MVRSIPALAKRKSARWGWTGAQQQTPNYVGRISSGFGRSWRSEVVASAQSLSASLSPFHAATHRHVDQTLVQAICAIEASGNKVLHAEMAHVAERHRRAMWVFLIPQRTRFQRAARAGLLVPRL